MVIALSDRPQAQLCPAWQRQGQAPSHHLHTALEWGQCPPQRGWEKPLSWGHLLGDRGLSEPHEPLSSQGRDTRQHSSGTGRGPAVSTEESCLPCFLEAGEVSCCSVFDSVLVLHLFWVPPSLSCPMHGSPCGRSHHSPWDPVLGCRSALQAVCAWRQGHGGHLHC